MPPLSAEEEKQEQELASMLNGAIAKLQRRKLQNAVLLAQQALRQGGELAEHFCKLGRRFGHLLEAPPKPVFRVVKGGAA